MCAPPICIAAGTDEEAALAAIRCALQRYVAHLGKADRYDEAMTRRYVQFIHRRVRGARRRRGLGGVRAAGIRMC